MKTRDFKETVDIMSKIYENLSIVMETIFFFLKKHQMGILEKKRIPSDMKHLLDGLNNRLEIT